MANHRNLIDTELVYLTALLDKWEEARVRAAEAGLTADDSVRAIIKAAEEKAVQVIANIRASMASIQRSHPQTE